MVTKRRSWQYAFFFAVLAGYSAAQSVGPTAESTSGNSDALLAVHHALFAAFLPTQELQKTPDVGPLLTTTEAELGAVAIKPGAVHDLLASFADLGSLGNACGIGSYLGSDHASSFAALTVPQRQHVLYLLATCDGNGPRRLYMSARNFYIAETYKVLQQPLTGVNLNLTASSAWIAEHKPVLPPTRLRYDPVAGEIFSTDTPIDYLIVGSGPAGSVLAHELRRGGKRVVLLDHGPFIVPGALQTRLIDELLDARTSDDGGIIIHNGMTVGGGSQVNVDLCFAPTLPAIQAKIQSWRDQGRIGADDFTRRQLDAEYKWVQSAIGTRKLSESEINPNNRVLWDGAKDAGLHPKLYDLNTYAPGRSPYPVTDKRSSESQLIMGALTDPNNPLSLIPDADVRRVLFEQSNGDETAVGVELRMRAASTFDGAIPDPNRLGIAAGQTVVIHARNVILSAGSLGSPAILLRSGVHNDQIGRGIILHPSVPVIGLFGKPINALSGTQASVYVDDYLIDRGYAFESMAAPPAYAAVMALGPAAHTLGVVRSYRDLAGFGVMLIDSVSPENRILLDENGEPVVHYTLSASDKQRLRQGVAEAVRMMLLAGAKEAYLPTTENLFGKPPAGELQPVVFTSTKQADMVARNLELVPNRTIITSAHMQATDKMGTDPANSVVARDFHVWGTHKLYVVDGSVFPTSVGANPMQSIYTFAKIFADEMTPKQ